MHKFILSFVFTAAVFAEDIQVNVSDYKSLPETKSDYDAIVVNPKGGVSETKASFDPKTGVLGVPNIEVADQSSVFVPDLDARYLRHQGNWINPQGYYWDGTNYVVSGDPNWRAGWNNYWHGPWNNAWGDYWNVHRGDANWRWGHDRNWSGHWGRHGRYNRHHPHGHHHGHHDGHHHGHHHGHHGHHHGHHHGGNHHKK